MHLRAAVSLTATSSFAALLISGLAVYLKPLGKTAAWMGWTLLGLGKEQWEAVHTLLGLLFACASLLHIALNLGPLLAYVSNPTRRASRYRLELAVAVACPLVFVLGAVVPFPPFSWVMDLNSQQKAQNEARHPMPFDEGEKIHLGEAFRTLGLAPAEGLRRLEASGLTAQGLHETLEHLARRHRTSPAHIHRSLIQGP